MTSLFFAYLFINSFHFISFQFPLVINHAKRVRERGREKREREKVKSEGEGREERNKL